MVYQAKHQYDEALDCYNQSLAIKRELSDRDGAATTLHQIGTAYQETYRYDEALDYYNQSLEIKQELGNRDGEVLTLAQTAVLFGARADFDESVRCFGIALSIALEHRMTIAVPILLNLATNLDYMGDEQFKAAWRKAFDGADPPLDLIREAKRLFEAADAD
jgi:tetratricopeptide (TPR) repeat protein